MSPDLTDALAFRSRLHEATRLVQALEGCEARHLAQLRETRGSLRDARKKLDQLIRGDAAPCPLFDRPTPAIAEPVPNVCVADIPAAPTPVPSCRVCGCTETIPCDEGCDWVGPDLCSACEGFEDLGQVVVREGAAFRLWRRGDVLIGSCLASEFGDWAHEEEHLEADEVDPHDYWPSANEVEKAVAGVITDRRVSYADYTINSASGRLRLVFDLVARKVSSAELAAQQLSGYPGWWGQAKDRTAEVERRMVEHRQRSIPEAPVDVTNRESIIAWRGRASAGDTTPQWEGWCEFEIDLGDGLTAEVLYEGPEKFLTRGTMKFWSVWVSETGFRSWTPFVPFTPAEDESLLAYATRIGLHLKGEETVAREKRCAKARREQRKAAQAGAKKDSGPKFYAWDVTYTRNNFEGDVTVTIVAKTEAQARKKALLRPNARDVVRVEGMTEEQYRRTHGSRRKRP